MRESSCRDIFDKRCGTYGSIKKIGKNSFVPKIGKFCSIASGVRWLTVSHNADWLTSFPFRQFFENTQIECPKIDGIHPICYEKLVIGHDVYIGMDTLFVGNITVGNGSIVGAGSVVRRDVEPYSIVFGNPAQFHKFKIPQIYIQDMERIAWWDWPLEKIFENANLLSTNKVKEFINKHIGDINDDRLKLQSV